MHRVNSDLKVAGEARWFGGLDAGRHDVRDAGKSGEAGAEARQPGLSTQSFRSIVDSTPLLRIMLLLRYTCPKKNHHLYP
jgi:hypothetical protein